MFASPVTRPFRWALPLAIAGLVVAALLDVTPVHAGGTDCGSVAAYGFGSTEGWFSLAPTLDVREQPIFTCPSKLRRRGALPGTVGFVALPPLIFFSVRGFLAG